ncbi:hypothetical protein NUW58_g8661 [Xylaria curta]|uniref:Uncharacterized protein n=1 Tax=Xylaria curta TaxID=42375 RepID=A0ACC1N567_9PEZI|nr:hypothetical protein NUW58_g8661 [Xylaria curta]
MRFINTITLELEDHLETIPRYAILSHTWGDGEVTLQDWSNPTIRDQLLSLLNELENENPMPDGTQEPLRVAQLNGAQIESDDYYWRRRLGLNNPIDSFGYWKILNTCLQARKDGLGHLWVDTNCIDKTSSAELSEAINSMYIWYRNSSICYAYLSDVRISDPTYTATYLATGKSISNLHGSSLDSFRKSRWFRRGWTLQELLAPKKVCFYSRTWTPIGTKKDMAPLLAELTRVGEQYLLSHDYAARGHRVLPARVCSSQYAVAA